MPHKQLDLIPQQPFVAPSDFEPLMKLLRGATSKRVVADFLKSKNLAHSGTWEDLESNRIRVGLETKSLTMEELVKLLSESEEYGHSHSFLFKCSKDEASRFVNDDKVSTVAAAQKLNVALGWGKVLELPMQPTISSIRLEEHGGMKTLVVKVIERREEKTFIKEYTEGKFFRMEWEVSEARAVNVIRLFANGLLEVRIASHSSKRYDTDIARIMKVVKEFLPQVPFEDYSLRKAKIELLSNPAPHEDYVKVSNSALRGKDGSTVIAASGRVDAGLIENETLSAFVGQFVKTPGCLCENTGLTFLAKTEAVPHEDIHVVLPERRNEFAVSASCAKTDYEYVFDKLRTLSS